MSKNKRTVILLLILAVLLVISPLFSEKTLTSADPTTPEASWWKKSREKPMSWFTPVLETFLGGEVPGEIESLIFCLQTGIGVGIIAFFMGRFVERKKWMKDTDPTED